MNGGDLAPISGGITFLAVVAVFDIRDRRIPNGLIVFGFTALLLTHVLGVPPTGQVVGPAAALSGLIVAAALTVPGWLLDKLGGGDVKLSILLGAFLGPLGFLWSVVLAVPFGIAFVVACLLSGRPVAQDLPVGAFLAGGAAVVLLISAWPLV